MGDLGWCMSVCLCRSNMYDLCVVKPNIHDAIWSHTIAMCALQIARSCTSHSTCRTEWNYFLFHTMRLNLMQPNRIVYIWLKTSNKVYYLKWWSLYMWIWYWQSVGIQVWTVYIYIYNRCEVYEFFMYSATTCFTNEISVSLSWLSLVDCNVVQWSLNYASIVCKAGWMME